MAYNKVVIDVEARFKDEITAEAKKVDKTIDQLERKKPKVVVDAETDEANRDLDKTGKKADDLGKKHPTPEVGIKDNATKKLDGLLEKTKKLADSVTTVAVKIRDNDTLAELSKIEEKARGIAGKTWTAAVKIKDMALAPLRAIEQKLFSIKGMATTLLTGLATKKFVVDPSNMYTDYEDLVAQFSVLLGGDDKAKKRLDELVAFAGETPYTRNDIFQASRVLQTYTEGALATPDATGGLRMIGDIASATGAEYTQVATYMGRLYNEVKRGGESLGEPLAFLREMGALSAEQELKIKEIAQGSGTIEQRWEKIAAQFSKTDGMMLKLSEQTQNLKLVVTSFFRNNLWMKLGEGINTAMKPYLVDFDNWLGKNKDVVRGWADGIKNFAHDAAGAVLEVGRNILKTGYEISQTEEFQNADIFGKIGMLWKGAIANPFAAWWRDTVVPWWDETAVPWLTNKAGDLGTTIGTGLSNGLLALFGVDVVDAAGQGKSIAGSFVQGFVDGFDGSAVADAIIGAIGEVWNALPVWAKILVGGIGVGKAAGGIASLAGGVASFAGGVSKFLGGANAGTGLLGAGTNTALALADLSGAQGITALSSGATAALGLGAIAGGAIGLGTAASGAYNLYKGIKNDDKTEKGAGLAKLGGVGAGAVAGAAIGSIVPVVGTAAGALIGAGLGGLAGIWGSKKIKENAAEEARSLKELSAAAEESSEASKVLETKQKALANVMGDVSLSAAEVRSIATNALHGVSEELDAFDTATSKANVSLIDLKQATQDLNKWNWKTSIGFKFSDSDKDKYKASITEYIESAQEYVENQHYEFTAAVNLLLDPESDGAQGIIKNGDAFYSKLLEDLNSATSKLTKKVNLALEDGEITADEQAIIKKYQDKVAEITGKLAEAETNAEMEALKIKFGAGQIDAESFGKLQEELAAQLESSELKYEEALKVGLTSLELQYPEHGEAYEEARSKLEEGFNENLKDLNLKAENLQLEILGEAWDIDAKTLSEGLSASIKENIAPMNWTPEDAQRFIGADGLTASMATGIGTALQAVAEQTRPLDIAALDVTGEDAVQETARTKVQGAIDEATRNPFSASAAMNLAIKVNTTYSGLPTGTTFNALDSGTKGTWIKEFRGGLVGPAGIRQFSNGGMVAGGAQLITVAEEGSPEMIIPMSSQRRGRALKLWAQAGHMLDVPGFANGGLVGGSGDEGFRHQQNAGSSGTTAGSTGIQVNVGGVTVEVNVQGGGDANIAEAIRAQGSEIAEEIAGILADAFNAQFENTPTKGVA